MINFAIKLTSLLSLLIAPTLTQATGNPDWAVRCETTGDKRCYLVQNVFLEENHQRLATLALSLQGRDYFALVSVPLGVNLPAGAQIQVDSIPATTVTYQMCNQVGCHGGVAVTRTLLRALQYGKKLIISYQDSTGRRVGVPLSLKDFNSGLDDLKSALATTSDRERK